MGSCANSLEAGNGGQPEHTVRMQLPIRTDLAPPPQGNAATCLLALAVMSDVQVLDTASPARCEWVGQWSDDPLWQSLQPMHRPGEALTHWALLAHVERLRRRPAGPVSGHAYDLALCLGDNIDNAQHNELATFLAIMAAGRAQLSAYGGVQEAGAELGPGPWPFWCPDATVADSWKPRGYPAVPDFVARASAEMVSPGLGFAWTSVPGNHDLMRQGTALPEPCIEAIAVGAAKMLRRPDGLRHVRDPLALFVEQPAAFSEGSTRLVQALAQRRAVNLQEWIAAHLERGAAGYGPDNLRRGSADTIIDTEHVRIVLLDTNLPAGDFQGSIGGAQLQWLDEQLSAVDAGIAQLAADTATGAGDQDDAVGGGADRQRRIRHDRIATQQILDVEFLEGIGFSNAIGRPKKGPEKAPGRARCGPKYASLAVCRLAAAGLEGL